MKQNDEGYFPLQDVLTNESYTREDMRNQMIFRYSIIGGAMLFLILFHQRLPFPYPLFFYVAFGAFLANLLMHILTFNKKKSRIAYNSFPYIDALSSPFIFACTGGFLSPFVISHIATNVGSVIGYTNNRLLALHSFLILLISYLSVAFLQKAGILPIYVGYAREMMHNNLFFAFVTLITSAIIIASYVLILLLNHRVHLMLDDIRNAFNSILQGTITVVGHDFFMDFTKNCVKTLRVRCAIIGEIVPKTHTLKTIAVWKDDALYPNDEWPLPDSVFEKLIANKTLTIETGLAEHCRKIPLFAFCNAAVFIGITLNDSSGKPIGVFCLVNDEPVPNRYLVDPLISIFASRAAAELERKQAEDKRTIIELQLAQAHKMSAIGQLVSGIAHDFNNMLSAIIGYAQLLDVKIEPASPLRRYIKHIIDAGNSNAEMISKLTHFVRRGTPQLSPVDVHKTLEETIQLLKRTISKSISIVNNFEAEKQFCIGDQTLLQNVFMNMGINARDAMGDEGGSLTFATFNTELAATNILCQSFDIHPGEYMAIAVSDTGSGMDDETLSHLFEPFFTTKPKGKGTGLGLANVWGYVENFNGAIDVKSKPGQGTTFTLYFQLVASLTQNIKRQDVQPAVSVPVTSVKNILVVDDDPAMRELTGAMLTESNCTISLFSGGAEALELFSKNPNAFDCVLLDVMMAGMNGHDTFYALRKAAPNIRIIMMSGLIEEKELKGILAEPLTAFIQKPFSKTLLMREISALCDTK